MDESVNINMEKYFGHTSFYTGPPHAVHILRYNHSRFLSFVQLKHLGIQ